MLDRKVHGGIALRLCDDVGVRGGIQGIVAEKSGQVGEGVDVAAAARQLDQKISRAFPVHHGGIPVDRVAKGRHIKAIEEKGVRSHESEAEHVLIQGDVKAFADLAPHAGVNDDIRHGASSSHVDCPA